MSIVSLPWKGENTKVKWKVEIFALTTTVPIFIIYMDIFRRIDQGSPFSFPSFHSSITHTIPFYRSTSYILKVLL